MAPLRIIGVNELEIEFLATRAATEFTSRLPRLQMSWETAPKRFLAFVLPLMWESNQ